jgi:hypothetical protein
MNINTTNCCGWENATGFWDHVLGGAIIVESMVYAIDNFSRV